jgi:hypothetical protein
VIVNGFQPAQDRAELRPMIVRNFFPELFPLWLLPSAERVRELEKFAIRRTRHEHGDDRDDPWEIPNGKGAKQRT